MIEIIDRLTLILENIFPWVVYLFVLIKFIFICEITHFLYGIAVWRTDTMN